MGRRIRLTAFALILAIPSIGMGQATIAWEDAFSLKASRPPRPKPSEPDATRDNSGPFRLANEFDQPAQADPPPRVQAPQVYELADTWGQRWQHPDSAWLQQWVASRNASAVRYHYGGAVCGPGGCPPRR